MSNDTLFKPSEVAPISGQYQIVSETGKDLPVREERTVVKGEPFPPTPISGQKYRLVDKTITKSA